MDQVEQYIHSFPEEIRIILSNVREIIKSTAPEAIESFAYKMPSYKLNMKPLVYFSGNKKHLGLYAMPITNVTFKDELEPYKQGKGSIQFQYSEAIPYDLITRIVKARVEELNV